MTGKRLYSISDISRETGVSRRVIGGVVLGLELPVYRGLKNAKLVDEAGYKRVKRVLRPRPEPMAV